MDDKIIIAIILVVIMIVLPYLLNIIYRNKYIKYNNFVKRLNSYNKTETFLLIYKTSKFTCFKEFDKKNEFLNFQIDNKDYIDVIRSYEIKDYVQYSQLE